MSRLSDVVSDALADAVDRYAPNALDDRQIDTISDAIVRDLADYLIGQHRE